MTPEITARSPVMDNARLREIFRLLQASTNQMTGAGAIMSNAVALSPPEDMMTKPKMAKYLNMGSRMILSVRPMIQGKSAHGSKRAEVREMYGKTYGDS